MAQSQKEIKQLEIKTGVLKRLIRERSSYEEEVVTEMARFDRMKSSGKEEADLRLQTEVIRETEAMVPDTQRRLTAAYDDMKKYLDKTQYLSESKPYRSAQEMLGEASKVLDK